MRNILKAVIVAAVSSHSVLADTYTWSAAASGDFETLSNWTLTSTGEAPAQLPGSSDDVVIPDLDAAYTVTVNSTLDIGSLAVGGAGGSAVATVCFNNGLATNEVAGAVIVGANGELTHTQLPSSANATIETLSSNVPYKLNLRAGGDVTVASGGKISADGRGFSPNKGPLASDTGGKAGAAHGGIGKAQSTKNLSAYGSIRNPVDPGSGGQNGSLGAGGVVCVIAGGGLVVEGTISAVASSGYASGGSVLMKASSVSVSGTVSVQGGSAGGGGGRIAIYTGESREFSSLGGTITAASGYKTLYGTCGSIYFESALHSPGKGELVFNGHNQTVSRPSYLNENIPDVAEPFGKITVKGGAMVSVKSSTTVTLTDGLSVAANYKINKKTYYSRLFTEGDGAGIHFAPSAGTTFSFDGIVATNHNFVCHAPGAGISCQDGSSMYIAEGGVLDLSGAPGNLLTLAAATGTWSLDVGEDSSISVSCVDVSGCDSSGGLTITAFNSVGADQNNTNWIFPAPVLPGDTLRWTGEEDTVWMNANNWRDKADGHRIPTETDVIFIPAGAARYPVLENTEDVVVNTLTNEAGASIALSGVNLTVTNSFMSAGTISRNKSEKLIFSGEGDATLDFAGGEYGDVHITKSGGRVAIPNGFSAERLKVGCSAATMFVLPAEKKLKTGVFDIDGTDEGFITLVSSSQGSAWKLEVDDVMRVRGVSVSDSDATSGRTVAAGVFAVDNGGNSNWDFTSGSAAEWIGGTDNNWMTPDNWSPAGVPGATAVVAIRPAAAAVSVVLDTQETIVPLGGLLLGGSDYTATLQCDTAIETAGGVDVAENALLVLNSIATNNIVNCDVIVRPGSMITHSGPQNSNTQLYGVNLAVCGDMTIEDAASVSAEDKGYSGGKGPGAGYAGSGGTYAPNGASHGGAGKFSSASVCYGSVFRPVTMGSPSRNASESGGQIAITVGGTLTVDGEVSADGSNGSGGSVWLTAGVLKGCGAISAKGNGAQSGSAGGRIALYETVAEDWNGFSGSVSAAADKDRNGHGTIYYQTAADESMGGLIEIKGRESAATGITPLPMSDDGQGRKVYSKSRIEVSGATLSITEGMVAADLNLIGTAGMVSITGCTLRVTSRNHRNGTGWGDTYESLVKAGEGGAIIWPAGMSLSVK